MTLGVGIFLLGLFAVPLTLLVVGHRIRRAPLRQQRVFWGAVIGHCIAVVLALVFGMLPPESWSETATLRGFFGLWALLVLPLAGAAGGALMPASRR